MALGGAKQVASMFGRIWLKDDMTPALNEVKGSVTRQTNDIGKRVRGIATAVGAALVGMGIYSAKAAVDWETAFAGVHKTVEATPEELAVLEEQLRDLATSEIVGSLNDAHTQVAGIAEAAGQFGIATGDIAAFAETMMMLGMSTNVSAEEAAVLVAQLMAVTKMPAEDIDQFGATVVALGNNFATTEGKVLDTAQRFGAVAASAGLSVPEILAMATAIGSIGMEAMAGGSAAQRFMMDISNAVTEGGSKLEVFAETAGMTADEFTEKWKEAPYEAIQAFVAGLEGMNLDDINAILGDLEISDVNITRLLSGLANAEGLLGDAAAVANEGWEEGAALTDEAGKRAGTTESEFERLKNTLDELAITVGTHLLPFVSDVATGLTLWVDKILEFVDAGDELGAIETIVQGIHSAATDAITGLADFVGGAVADLLNIEWVGAEKGVQIFFDSVSGLVELLRDQLLIKIDEVKTAINNWWNNVKQGVQDFVDGITEKLEPVVTFIESIVSGIEDVLRGLGIIQGGGEGVTEEQQERANELLQRDFKGLASGGPVFGGTPYIVGERGPELFVPGSAGSIVPNHALGGPQVIIQAVYVQDEDPQRWLDRLNDAVRQRGLTTATGVW